MSPLNSILIDSTVSPLFFLFFSPCRLVPLVIYYFLHVILHPLSTEAYLNVASTGAWNKMIFNRLLHSLAVSPLSWVETSPAPEPELWIPRLPLFITLSSSLLSVFLTLAPGLGEPWGRLQRRVCVIALLSLALFLKTPCTSPPPPPVVSH